MKRKIETFIPDEFEDILSSMDIAQLIDLESEYKNQIVELQDEADTNRNMIDKYIDNPGMEHLIDMSIQSSATDFDVCIAKLKLDMIQKAIKAEEERENKCRACKV